MYCRVKDKIGGAKTGANGEKLKWKIRGQKTEGGNQIGSDIGTNTITRTGDALEPVDYPPLCVASVFFRGTGFVNHTAGISQSRGIIINNPRSRNTSFYAPGFTFSSA
jgi:hypothetical protein